MCKLSGDTEINEHTYTYNIDTYNIFFFYKRYRYLDELYCQAIKNHHLCKTSAEGVRIYIAA